MEPIHLLDSFPGYRLGESDPGADGRPIADPEVSGDSGCTARPSFSSMGLPSPVAFGAFGCTECSSATDTVGAGAAAGRANIAGLNRRLLATIIFRFYYGDHPLSAPAWGEEKEQNPLIQ